MKQSCIYHIICVIWWIKIKNVNIYYIYIIIFISVGCRSYNLKFREKNSHLHQKKLSAKFPQTRPIPWHIFLLMDGFSNVDNNIKTYECYVNKNIKEEKN